MEVVQLIRKCHSLIWRWCSLISGSVIALYGSGAAYKEVSQPYMEMVQTQPRYPYTAIIALNETANSSCAAFRCAMARERDRAPQIRTTAANIKVLCSSLRRLIDFFTVEYSSEKSF